MYWTAAAVSWTVDHYHAPVRGERMYQRTPTARIDPEAVPQHGWRPRADLRNTQPPEAGGHQAGLGLVRDHVDPPPVTSKQKLAPTNSIPAPVTRRPIRDELPHRPGPGHRVHVFVRPTPASRICGLFQDDVQLTGDLMGQA
jgi:hypothetical protein